jgi:hypothetical protein
MHKRLNAYWVTVKRLTVEKLCLGAHKEVGQALGVEHFLVVCK